MWPVIARIPLPFTLFGADQLPVHAFGLMVVLALLAGNAVAVRLARRAGVDEDFMGNLFVVFTVSAIVGGRLFYVATNWSSYEDDWLRIFKLQEGGLVYYGSFLLCFLTVTWYIRRHRQSILKVLDIYAVAAPLGMSIGRIGCLLVGDDYGKPCAEDFPLRIMFSTQTTPGRFLGITIPADNGNLCALRGEWLHPAQIYMSLNALAMFLVLRWLWPRRRFDGQIVATFVMLYAVMRSVIELFRGDEDRGYVGALSTAQFVSLFTFAAGAALLVVAWRRGSKAGSPASS